MPKTQFEFVLHHQEQIHGTLLQVSKKNYCVKGRKGLFDVVNISNGAHCAFGALFGGARKPLCWVVGSHIGLDA